MMSKYSPISAYLRWRERRSKPCEIIPVSGESGFSLVEVAVAMVVILIALLGVSLTVSYAITYNAGNYQRAQALAVLQREAEQIRSAKFTPSFTDTVLRGGTQADRTVQLPNMTTYVVGITVDNDPLTPGIQDESVFTNFKEIVITARVANTGQGFVGAVPAKVVLRRVKSN